MYGSSFLSRSSISSSISRKVLQKSKSIVDKVNSIKASVCKISTRSAQQSEVDENQAMNVSEEGFIGPKFPVVEPYVMDWLEAIESMRMEKSKLDSDNECLKNFVSVEDLKQTGEEEEVLQQDNLEEEFVIKESAMLMKRTKEVNAIESKGMIEENVETIVVTTVSENGQEDANQETEVILKIIVKNKVITYTFKLKKKCGIGEVRAIIEEKWKEENNAVTVDNTPRTCKIKYVDGERDWITIVLENEWEEAMNVCKPLIELYAW